MSLFFRIGTHQWQWRSCTVFLVSSRQLHALPSDRGHQQLFSMWEVWHFEASDSTSPVCNVHCLHGSSCQLYWVRDLARPISLLANTNVRSNPAHSTAPLEWAWVELSVKTMDMDEQITFQYTHQKTLNVLFFCTYIREPTFYRSLSWVLSFRHFCCFLFNLLRAWRCRSECPPPRE